MATAERKKGRRPAGDGSVYKVADGRWRGVVDLGWIDGKRRRKYVAGATQAHALEKLGRLSVPRPPASSPTTASPSGRSWSAG